MDPRFTLGWSTTLLASGSFAVDATHVALIRAQDPRVAQEAIARVEAELERRQAEMPAPIEPRNRAERRAQARARKRTR